MTTAVLLLYHGGAERPEDLAPYLEAVLGAPPPPGLLETVRGRYAAMGGRSPLPETARRQAAALESVLRASGPFAVRPAAAYTRPNIPEALEELLALRPESLVVLPQTPYPCRLTTGRWYAELDRALAGRPAPEVARVRSWHGSSLLVEALAASLRAALDALPEERRAEADVLFTAHSVPRGIVEDGDPYPKAVDETVHRVGRTAGLRWWKQGWQSRGAGAEAWLGPDAAQAVERLAEEGCCDLLVHPVGFLADHLETLYDLDTDLRARAEALGLRFHRVPCLNDDPRLIRAMADQVRRHVPRREAAHA